MYSSEMILMPFNQIQVDKRSIYDSQLIKRMKKLDIAHMVLTLLFLPPEEEGGIATLLWKEML